MSKRIAAGVFIGTLLVFVPLGIFAYAHIAAGSEEYLDESFDHPIVQTSRTTRAVEILRELVLTGDARDFRNEVRTYSYLEDVPLETYRTYYERVGVETMLRILDRDPYCHIKGHNMGRVIFEKSQGDLEVSLHSAGDHCSNAVFHGVLMEAFKAHAQELESDHVQARDIASYAESLCMLSEVPVTQAACFHGIGHALMYLAHNDLVKGLYLCDALDGVPAKHFCVTGVYMERDQKSGDADSAKARLYPCDTTLDPAACYRYKLRRIFTQDQSVQARSLCTGLASTTERRGCFHGLGYAFFKSAMTNPKGLEQLCLTEDDVSTRMCAEGAAGPLHNFLSRDEMRLFCDTQQGALRRWCDHRLSIKNPEDFGTYYTGASE